MSLNFKKISAIVASTLMIGLSAGTIAAANYPAPFITGAGADAAIVYGTGAGVSSLDVVQAGNIEANLQSFMSAGGGSTTTTVSGGDSKILSSSTRKIYYGDAENAALTSLTYTELPTILASGTVTDLSGTAYGYTQTVKVGAAAVTFGTSGGDLNDPTLYIDAGNNGALTAGQIYNYTVSFTKSINVSDATNVQGQKLKLQGIDYVIGASSTNSTLYLYGSGQTVIISSAGNQSVNIGGVDHSVELVTTTSSNAIIRVDGVSKTVVAGSNYAFSGGINVYVKTIINPSYAGDLRQVELIVGASSLQLNNGQTVKKGADATSIAGTSATITAAGNGIISGFTVAIGAQKTQNDSIALGQSYTDPVFGGLKVTLANVVPTTDSSARARIVADAGSSNTQAAYVTFTSARSGSKGEQKIMYVYDNNTLSSAVQPLLAHSTQPSSNAKGIIHVLEGENARVGDWIVVNQGDAGTILEVTSMDNKDATSGTVTLTDVITGESQVLTVTNDTASCFTNTNVNAWGGTGYTISVNAASTLMNISWSGSGTKSVFPRIKLANGGWLSFLTQTAITNYTNVILPDAQATLSTTSSNFSTDRTTYMPAGINWTTKDIVGVPTIVGINNTNTYCNFNSTLGPALLYLEPKKWDDQTYGNFICIPLITTGTTQIAMGDPLFNGSTSGFITYGSDTYKKAAVDKYGTFTVKEDRTNQNGLATLYLAPSQMYLDVVFASPDASISGGTVTVSGAQLGDILVKDSEVASVSSSKNLVVVGGSCINSVAATLLGGNYCTSDFTTKTGVGSGQFLIQSFGDAFSTGNIALLVAGYDAADTVHAATYLRNQAVDTTAGKKYLGTSETSATLQVV
jgi:hypothetical protein